jgi:hypothetical protein
LLGLRARSSAAIAGIAMPLRAEALGKLRGQAITAQAAIDLS